MLAIRNKAFTLIELLVVIVIIGILATISISTYNNFISDADVARDLANLSSKISKLKVLRLQHEIGSITPQEIMEADLDVVAEALYILRKKQDATLYTLTGEVDCYDCDCRNHSFVPVLTSNAQMCVDRWDEIMVILRQSTDIDISFLESDPWGSPYLFDQNEGEQSNNYCRKDTLFSAGPDKLHEASGEDAAGDGYSIRLNFYDKAQCGT